MPKPATYRSGSVIYFQGDEADKIYVVQAGLVDLAYQDIETGEDIHDSVQPGVFFGVKSALGGFPREENAITLQNTTVMSFTIPEFETWAAANSRLIMKMLKVFSNQMRRIHAQLSNVIKVDTEQESPEAGLFRVGEYYLKNKRFSQARYIFSRYLTYYPTGEDAARASKFLAFVEGVLSQNPAPRLEPYRKAPSKPEPELPGPEPKAPPKEAEELSRTANAYYNGLSLIAQQKYQEAFQIFKKILEENIEEEYSAKSFFEIGHCLYLLGKYEVSIKHFTLMITKYPKHPDLGDVLFYIGQCHEKCGRAGQAAGFYKKVISMESDEGTKLKAKRALNKLEA